LWKRCGEILAARMSEDYKTAHTKTGGEQVTYQNKAEGSNHIFQSHIILL
jgi:hypothetical protein